MIQIHVSLFATLRQIAGWKERLVEVPEDTTLGALMEKLTEQHPELNLTKRTLYAAVNREYARPETRLADGDDVAIFPPVSGGERTIQYYSNGRIQTVVQYENHD